MAHLGEDAASAWLLANHMLRSEADRDHDGPLVAQELDDLGRLDAEVVDCAVRWGAGASRACTREQPRRQYKPSVRAVRRTPLGSERFCARFLSRTACSRSDMCSLIDLMRHTGGSASATVRMRSAFAALAMARASASGTTPTWLPLLSMTRTGSCLIPRFATGRGMRSGLRDPPPLPLPPPPPPPLPPLPPDGRWAPPPPPRWGGAANVRDITPMQLIRPAPTAGFSNSITETGRLNKRIRLIIPRYKNVSGRVHTRPSCQLMSAVRRTVQAGAVLQIAKVSSAARFSPHHGMYDTVECKVNMGDSDRDSDGLTDRYVRAQLLLPASETIFTCRANFAGAAPAATPGPLCQSKGQTLHFWQVRSATGTQAPSDAGTDPAVTGMPVTLAEPLSLHAVHGPGATGYDSATGSLRLTGSLTTALHCQRCGDCSIGINASWILLGSA